MQDPNSRQVGGEHYKAAYQHWDLCADAPLNYFEGQATKYLARWRKKGGLQDLEKSLHYFEKLFKLYQERRLNLPVAPRRSSPVDKFCDGLSFEPWEREVFRAVVTYTSLAELQDLWKRVETEVHRARAAAEDSATK